MIGVKHYLQIDYNELLNIETWTDAGTQILWSFGLCMGAHIAFGSYSQKNNNVFKQCIGLGFLCSLTSFISGFAVFGVLGYLSAELGLPVEKVVKGGPGLVFLTYPTAISLMPYARFWSVLFFAMLFLLGIDSQLLITESLITAVKDSK